MTVEEVKKVLKGYADAETEIRQLQDEIALWRSRCEMAGVSLGERVQGGKRDNPADTLVELLDTLKIRVVEAAALRMTVEKLLDGVANKRDRLILEQRYIRRKTWESIANDAFLDVRWIMRIHAYAIKALAS